MVFSSLVMGGTPDAIQLFGAIRRSLHSNLFMLSHQNTQICPRCERFTPPFVRVLCDCLKSRRRLEAEILMLRHQLNVLQQRAPRRAKGSPDLEDELAPKMARLA